MDQSSPTIHSFFENSTVLYPDKLAVVFNNESITYRELNKKAEALSKILISKAAGEKIIGLSTTRSIDMIIGMLAILKSGKAYMPIDPEYPVERQQYMVDISEVHYIVANDAEEGIWEKLGLNRLGFTDFEELETYDPHYKGDIAIILFTSGSTGKPKGVVLGHQGLCEYLNFQKTYPWIHTGAKTLQFTHIGFDASVFEIFGTLFSGGELHLIGGIERLDPLNTLEYIIENGINRIFLPYVALQNLVEEALSSNKIPFTLTEITSGGELMKISNGIRLFFSKIPNAILKNIYGPTETSISVTELVLMGDPNKWEDIPSIGKEIANCRLLVMDKALNILPIGHIGELHIAGNCLAQGYLNRDDLTKEKFVKWTSPSGEEIKLYKTGDLVFKDENGFFRYRGREDDQVKIRGNRVEIGEVELALNKVEGVRLAVVKLDLDASGQKFLCGYVQFLDGNKINLSQVRNVLKKSLPDYMIPDLLVEVKEFAKTSSGKVDKKALPKPIHKRPEWMGEVASPSNLVEKHIHGVFLEILNYESIGVHDNFFDLGGNSLKAQALISTLRQKYPVPITKLYQFPTIKGLANFVFGEKATESSHKRKLAPNSVDIDVAVIGIELNFPGASSVESFLELLRNGRETISVFARNELDSSISSKLKNDPNYVPARGVLKDFDKFDSAFFGLNPKLASIADPQLRKFLESSYALLEQAGYESDKGTDQIGVFAGSSMNTYFNHNLRSNMDFVESFGDFQVASLNEKDFIASRTAYHLNLTGPAVSVYSACSTSLMAVAQAVEAIRAGKCEVALAGGSSIKSPVFSGHLYEEGSVNSKDGHVNSFDKNAHGTVFSDGVGVILLKRLDLAVEDGDEIFAVIKGTGVNNDGGGKGSFSGPSASGQSEAIRQAIIEAKIDPNDIGYIEAHATATPIGDPIEIEGLKMAFGPTENKQYCAIGTVKANIGHLNAASGIAGLIKAVLSVKHGEFFPQINFKEPNPVIDFEDSPFFVNTKLKNWVSEKKRLAGVSSFGVGGTNVHVILEEYPSKQANRDFEKKIDKPAYLIPWSAKSYESLELYADKLLGYLSTNGTIHLGDVSHTLSNCRPEYPQRTFLVVSDVEDLKTKLTSHKTKGKFSKDNSGVIFMFPGQGAQYLQMGKEIYANNLVFKNALDECAKILEEVLDIPLLEIIFSNENRERSQEILRNTKYTQPCIFAIEYALAKVFMDMGIIPVAMCGHSVGEFVAAHLSGIFSLSQALHLVAKRGALVASLPTGSMLSVRCSEEQLGEICPKSLSLAGVNGPNQCVVAGEKDEIALFIEKLTNKEIPNRLLKTSHAFHSHMMAPIMGEFRDILEAVELKIPRIPIVSTVTGNLLKDKEAISIDYWTDHLRNPVRFFDAANTLFGIDGENVLLEVGPGNVLTSLCKQSTLSGEKIILNSLTPDGYHSEYGNFLQALGALWSAGVKIKWESLQEKQGKKLSLPTYAFKKEKIWLDPVSDFNIPHEKTIIPKNVEIQNTQHLNSTFSMDRKPQIRTQIVDLIQETSGLSVPSDNASFFELGFDSLLLTQLASGLKRKFDVSITFRQLNESISDLDSLVAHLDKVLPLDLFKEQKYDSDQVEVISLNASNASLQENFNSAKIAESYIPSGKSSTHLGLISLQLELLSKQIKLLNGQQEEQSQTINPSTITSVNTPVSKSPQPSAKVEFGPKQNVPKTFGAMAKIEKNSSALSLNQKHFLNDFIERFNRKTKTSKAFTQEHRPYMADPRVVSGFKPAIKEITYSLVVNKSKGNRLWDIDGNEYLDALNGFGSILLGHNPDFIRDAIQQQLHKGYEVGPQHELSGEVCKLVCEMTGHERSALCNTGSEAVMGAVRMARTLTGRSLIVSFNGSYHGIFDEVIVRGLPNGKSYPAAAGIMPESVHNILVLDYGTPESLEIIRERRHEIAAILVEPVQSRRPEFQPVEFLRTLRTICDESESALIFDEVITGFRMHLRGAQGLFGIQADIAAYGKVAGGGLSIGIIAGKSKYMDALDGGMWQFGDDSVPEIGVTYFAGTFVRHPLALASTKASLEFLKNDNGKLQKSLKELTERLAKGLDDIFKENSLPFYVAHFGSLWKVKYHQELPYTELIFAILREKGIHIYDGFPCFLTTAYLEEDVDRIIISFREAIEELVQVGFFANGEQIETSVKSRTILSKNEPPIPGARLGKDKSGLAAWFIRDSNNPDKFRKLNIEN